MKLTKKRLIIFLAVLVAIIASATIAFGSSHDATPTPSIAYAPYKAVAKTGEVYYPNAYGIKADGVLRIEVPYFNNADKVVELNEKREVMGATGSIKIYELPPGWRLYNRATGKEIKANGGI